MREWAGVEGGGDGGGARGKDKQDAALRHELCVVVVHAAVGCGSQQVQGGEGEGEGQEARTRRMPTCATNCA